ncbi:MAG: ABC transporter ATP-binding protein [Deltaproteobacteria bacterium]|nr:ABC transporter ATP-binding protein [Deltaproteobacteria bacterium]
MNPEETGIGQRIKTALQLWRALRLVWLTAPGWTVVNFSLLIFQSALPLAALYLIKRILDAVGAGLKTPQPIDAFQSVLFWVLLAAGVALLNVLLRSVSEYTSQAQSLQVTDSVADIMHAKSIAMDLEYYEDPAYYNTLHRAQREAPHRPTSIINHLIQAAQNGFSLLGILGLLITFNWLLVLILFAATIPGIFIRLINSRRLYGFEQVQTEKERRSWYYHDILTDKMNAKELRLFELGNLFKSRYNDLRQDIRSGRLKLARIRSGYDLLAQWLTIAALFGSLAWIVHQTLLGSVTLGDLMVYYLGFQSGLSFLQAAVRALSGLYEDNLFLTDLYRFLDLKPRIITPGDAKPIPKPVPCKIDFENVGFTYANHEDETLRGISLTVNPGQVVALVGENGSGKTTLVKLLCRLYDPTRGAIRVNGVDLRDLDLVEWRREIAVTFQDYVHYELTAWENIWLGDTKMAPDISEIMKTGQRSGADQVINRLPGTYDTVLGQWFENGQELSTGEWQKIALARSFWRKANIFILDEPTSSLDPLAEAGLFDRFRELLGGHSAILISHRFSTVQMADCIYVMDKGQIIEHGTHAELLRQNGHYARLYLTQARHYQDR